MNGYINLGHIQKFLCHEECLKCDAAKRIWLEGKASLHWNLENNKRLFLSHSIEADIKCSSLTSLGDNFYDVETIDIVKILPVKRPKLDIYEYHSGLEKIIFYNDDSKVRNCRYFGNKISLSREVFKKSMKKRKLESSFLAAAPAAPWLKADVDAVSDPSDPSCKDMSTVRGLKKCRERIEQEEKPAPQENNLKYVLEQALKSIESRGDEVKAPSMFISKEGVNFKGYHPSAKRDELFEQAFGKLPMFDKKSTDTPIAPNAPVVNVGIAGITPTMRTNVTQSLSNLPNSNSHNMPLLPSFSPQTSGSGIENLFTPNALTSQAPQFSPFMGQAQAQTQANSNVNPFAAQFPSARRRGRSRR